MRKENASQVLMESSPHALVTTPPKALLFVVAAGPVSAKPFWGLLPGVSCCRGEEESRKLKNVARQVAEVYLGRLCRCFHMDRKFDVHSLMIC